MRVLSVTGLSHLPQRVGGSQSATHDLCEALGRLGAETGVLAALEPRGFLAFRNRVRRKLTRRLFPADRAMGYPVFRGWSPEHGVPEVASAFRPDCAIAWAGRPVPIVRSLVAERIPTIFYLQDVGFERMGGELPADDLIRYVANSRFTAAQLRDRTGLDADVVPPLVNPESYRTDTTGDVVLFVCPHPDKGAETAFRLAESRPDVPFLFQESWRLRAGLRDEWLKRARAAGNIEWQEPVADMRAVYRRARVVLAPSRNEAWGRVATEAQVSAIPLLASDQGGLPESVGPGGILVDPDAPLDRWREGLSILWDDPEAYRRYSDAARDHSKREEIQPATLVRKLLRIMEEHVERARDAERAGSTELPC